MREITKLFPLEWEPFIWLKTLWAWTDDFILIREGLVAQQLTSVATGNASCDISYDPDGEGETHCRQHSILESVPMLGSQSTLMSNRVSYVLGSLFALFALTKPDTNHPTS